MNTVEELNEQSRLAVIAFLRDSENVELECILKYNPDNYDSSEKLNWQYNHFAINLGNTWYRIAPKKLWYKVALCRNIGEYYTITADTDRQSQQCEVNPNFIKWITPDKVYYTVEKERNNT